MKNPLKPRVAFLFGIALFLFTSLQAQETLFQKLSGMDSLSFHIVTDLDSLLKKRDDYVDGELMIYSAGNQEEQWDVRLKPRGRFRRKECSIPPLQLDFSKKDLRKAGFAEFDKFKLVCPCEEDEESQELINREFLIYRAYNVVTEASFRTKQVQFVIRDKDDPELVRKFWGFVLEPNDELAARLNGEDSEIFNISPDSLAPQAYTNVALLEFMIGNYDWNVQLSKNVRLIRSRESGLYITVPYDFDFSGLVGAEYAVVPREFGITHRNDRVYMGMHHSDQLQQSVDLFLKKEKAIREVFQETSLLERAAKREIRQSLQTFFSFLKTSPESLTFKFVLKYDHQE